MPTVFRDGPYRFVFYSIDRSEPPHVHVKRDAAHAKFWIVPVKLESARGFRSHELVRIRSIIEDREHEFLEAWSAFFTP